MKLADQLAELRSLPEAELRQRAADLDEQVFRLRLQRSLGQAESGNKVRPLRKTLARIRTILREKGVKG
jgi:large subunit ribosomal protein L29